MPGVQQSLVSNYKILKGKTHKLQILNFQQTSRIQDFSLDFKCSNVVSTFDSYSQSYSNLVINRVNLSLLHTLFKISTLHVPFILVKMSNVFPPHVSLPLVLYKAIVISFVVVFIFHFL